MKKLTYYVLIAMLVLTLFTACSTEKEIKSSSLETEGSTIPSAASDIPNEYINNRNYFVDADTEYIYYIDYMSIKKLSKTDGNVENVFTCDKMLLAIKYFDNRIYMITGTELISVDFNGEDILKTSVLNDKNQFIGDSFFVLKDKIYLVSSFAKTAYQINPKDLNLVIDEYNIKNKHTAKDKTFEYKQEGEIGRLYLSDIGGKFSLISEKNEVVRDYFTFVINNKIFYGVSSESLSTIKFYKMDLGDGNKTLIKEFNIEQDAVSMYYDTDFIYLYLNQTEFLKINQNTLETINIRHLVEDISFYTEIIDEKIFYLFIETPFYIDTITGETFYL